MKKIFIPVLTFFIAAAFLLAGCSKTDDMVVTPPPPPPPPPAPTPVAKPNQEFYGISASNVLVKYNANASQTVLAQVAVTGLQAGENLLAIDFRPATGQLYGLGNSNRLYVINIQTGAARAIGTAPFTPALADAIAGFDFNPTVDRIRVVTTGGQNLRLHPELGTVAAVDGTINNTERITGVAYTNSFAGASATTLFDIDGFFLFKQDPPNNGTITKIGSLGLDAVGTGGSDFDISPDNKVALVPMTVNGVNSLYQLDTASGKLINLGQLMVPIIGLAIPTNPVGYGIDNANNLSIFDLRTAAFGVTKPVTGLQAGETILGIDMRPATGQLYALGSTSRLYTINMSSGAAAAVGTAPFTTLLSGTSFGFDFNPAVDRIRVVSNTGQNLRLDPNTGLIAAVDGTLNPGTPNVASAAYTNNFAGTTTTTLYVIDAGTDKLYIQTPPNNGTLAEVGSLGINITADNGFDIGGTSGKAYGTFSIGGFTKLYTLDLATGLVVGQVDYPGTAKGFAVGLGF
ncbi:MAG: DUF4394 domain-containing protein [Ferruginibacter sp.]|nr:DUF4394 domain-containing protein [Ferruginibacter sp.]